MTLPFTIESQEDWALAAEMWNAQYPAEFMLDGSQLKRSVSESSAFVRDGSFIRADSKTKAWQWSLLVLKGTRAANLFAGQDTSRAHVGLWISPHLPDMSGSLFASALESARELCFRSLAFGADLDHLLPGCPENTPELLKSLQNLGFQETGRCFDLERDLGDYEFPEECGRALHDHGASVRPCSQEDRFALDEYFARVFPGRWRHDVMRKHGEEPDQVYVLEIDGHILGHAMTQQDGCQRPVAGAVWHLSLGKHWGALGSIGIDSAIRGRGLGNALLGKALQSLQSRGARQTIIDWTTLGDFYGAHGFTITRRYVQMALDLSTL